MHSTLITTLLVALIAVTAFADELDFDELKSKLPEDLLPDAFKNTSLPTVDDAKTLIKDKCTRVAGSDAAYEEAEQASTDMKECLENIIDVAQLQAEIKEAEPTGDLDMVFNKYCRRRQEAIDCMNNFTASIDHCLEADEKKSRDMFVNIFTNLLNFVCHKDGDQIALFIAEKGPECFQEQADAMKDCANATFSQYLPKEGPSITNLPKFVFGTQECRDMDQLQVCIVRELEKCQESTPANLVDAMFKFVRNETPCANQTNKAEPRVKGKTNASNDQQVSTFIVLGTLAMTLIARSLVQY